MPKSVGKLFRPVVIEPELRELVNEILTARSSSDPAAEAARHRIAEKATRDKSYLYAVEIRNYLEEKTRVGTEPRLFTIAGDLFLDALEANLASVGPNFFKDHYGGVFGCYKEGRDRGKSIEGPIFCLDLLLLKALELALEGEQAPPVDTTPVPAFVPEETSAGRGRLRDCLQFAERIVKDVVQQALDTRKGDVPPRLLEFVAGHRARMEKIVPAWSRFLPEIGPEQPREAALQAALEAAHRTGYVPLVAGVEERLALLHDPERQGTRESARLYYDAADRLMMHGSLERDCEAFNLALRRFVRAGELFERIRDRTSTAKALVEQARIYIRKGGDGSHTRNCLHKAVRLVLAHRDGMPMGRLPVLDHASVIAFLDSKGYHAEAKAYEATLEKLAGL